MQSGDDIMATAKQAQPKTMSPWLRRDNHLVYLRIEIKWRPAVSDLSMNTGLAEKWEGRFTNWSADERSFRFAEVKKAFRATLSDGRAQFHIESDPAFDQGVVSVIELFSELERRRRNVQSMASTAQFLQPCADDFESMVNVVNTRLLNNEFPTRLGFELKDVAYLADFDVGGHWFQVNAGAVRAHEVPRRVKALTLKDIPPVAYFYSVTGMKSTGEINARGTVELVEQLLDIGSRVSKELTP
jgi:hypothetical protein